MTGFKHEAKPSDTRTTQRGLITQNAMVVIAREEASKNGAAIMKQGGNAFDALFGAEMALAVVYPHAGNLGVVGL